MMHWIAVFGRFLLAAVFLVAAVGKLADRQGSRQAVADFGVHDRVVTPIAFMLPLVEIAIAALLIFGTSTRIGAVAALTLLLMFIAAITINLARGRTPDCHCFGQLHSAPVGISTVVRNGFLVAVAGVVLWQGGENAGIATLGVATDVSAVVWIALVVALIALAVAALEAWLLLGMIPQQGRLLMRVEALEAAAGIQSRESGLPVGEQAPEFELRTLDNNRVSLAKLRSSARPLLLFFTNPHCVPCDELLPAVARWQREYDDRLTIALISRDSLELNRAKATKHGLRTLLLQTAREVAQAYHVESTPAAVLIDLDGRIASQVVYGPQGIEALLRQTVEGAVPSLAPAIGQRAPTVVLPDLEGKATALADLRGDPTLVLFWNPDCGFCQRFLPELKAWERKRPLQSPRVLVVSTGDVEANRAMGLASPVVLDAEGSAMRGFGVSGTPMAVLVDGEGRIASSVAAGAQEVLALAGRS